MELLFGLAVVLIISYGIVSFIQRRNEIHRRMETVMRERNRIAGSVTTLQTECEFLQVYRECDSGKIAEELAQRMGVLESVFKETIDDLDKLVKGKYSRLDRQVHTARIMESFEKINREIADFREKLNAFHDTLAKSKRMIEPLHGQFEEAKNIISKILGEGCPSAWLDQWREIEQFITKLSLAQGNKDSSITTNHISEHVEHWMETAQSVTVWSEWKSENEKRTQTFTSCMNKISTNNAEHTYVACLLKETIARANEVVSLNESQLAEKKTFDLCQNLNRDLPAILSIVMQFLAVLTQSQSVATFGVRLASEADKVLKEIQSKSFSEKERLVVDTETKRFEMKIEKLQLEKALEEAIFHMQNIPAMITNEVISDIDLLLYIPFRFHQYMNEVERAYLVHVTESKELDERLTNLLSSVSQALAKLAGVKLVSSDEYRKLSKWQDELELLDSNGGVSADTLSHFERRIANEIVVVEGLVRGHKSLDASLEGHLDKLSHSGRYSGSPIDLRHEWGARNSGAGDLLSVAFTSLMIGEILNSDSFNSDLDNW